MSLTELAEFPPQASLHPSVPRTCPVRVLTDQLADKWSICVLLALGDGPVRFNALKRTVEGVTQKMLGQTLRRLEANGLVERRAFATMPMRVEYEITALGGTLTPIIRTLQDWADANHSAVTDARARFEAAVERDRPH